MEQKKPKGCIVMYKLKNIGRFLLVSATVFLLLGCGSDNSESLVPTTPEIPVVGSKVVNISLEQPSITVDTNKMQVTITVRAVDANNAPATTGKVKIVYPAKVQSGTDVGQFLPLEANVTNGVATFTYTAPSDMQSLVNAGDTSSEFKFYHETNVAGAKTLTVNYAPQVGQVVEKQYKINLQSADNNILVPLEGAKAFTATLLDTAGAKVKAAAITSMTITSLNPAVGSLTYLGVVNNNISVDNSNDIAFTFKSNTISGIAPIRVVAVFTDSLGASKTLEQVFNTLVLSGPPTAISMSYSGTIQDKDKAKFIEKWVVTVTDKYFNPVNTNPSISMGMIAGYATTDGAVGSEFNASKWLYVNTKGESPIGVTGRPTGTIRAGNPSTFTSANMFAGVDVNNDVLATFGNGYTYNVSGKWDFTKFSSSILNLIDGFSGSERDGLGYAIGHNYRQDQCRDGEEWVGNVYPENGNFTVDSSGTMRIDVKYDYYLTGKSVVLWVYLIGKNNVDNTTVRMGEAKKITLRALGLDGGTFNVPKGTIVTRTIPVQITGTTEWYRNANFGYKVATAGTAAWTIDDTSMNHGISDCAQRGGVAYITVTGDDTASSTPEGGTFTMLDVLASQEF